MKLFAIGDLHLNGKADKPMDVFGSNWDRHREKIFDAWQSLVSPSDCVLVPGDICWAMYLEDAVDDLNSIAELNGTKILIRGNHDYWWASPTRIRAVLPAGMYMLPSAANFGKADEKIFNRELIRLEMSLKAARRAPVITMLHYPPVAENGMRTAFTELISQYPVQQVVYGHLHAQSCRLGFNGTLDGIRYSLCSADFLNFAPKQIAEF